MNDLFLRALRQQEVERPPIWLMRQAGRYLPEYQKIRQHHSLMEMFQTPDLAVEVTLQPIRRFGFDAAIVFADILLIAQCFGITLDFHDGIGPRFQNISPIGSLWKYQSAQDRLAYVGEIIERLKAQLHVPLLGFCGSPFTVGAYLIEQQGKSKELETTRRLMYQEPHKVHALVEQLTQATIDYLHMQIRAGVDAIQIFESWGHMISPEMFDEFSKPYLDKILRSVEQHVPVIMFARDTQGHLKTLQQLSPSVISVDWKSSLAFIKEASDITIQGNLDPAILLTSPQIVEKEVRALCSLMANRPGFIFNLGHGILPHTPLSNVQSLINTVHSYAALSC